MTAYSRITVPTPTLPAGAGWAAAAFVVAAGCAALPPAWSLVGLAVLVFAVVCAISPPAALAAMLVVAPLRALIATESALRLPLDVGQLALLAVLASAFIARTVGGRPWRLHIPPLIWAPLGGFIIATGLTAFTAGSFSAWLTEWLKWVQIGILVALCVAMRGSWRWIAFGLVVAGCANAVIGLYQFFGGSGALHLLVSDRFFRAFGTFGQPNPFGGFMGLVAPIALTLATGALHRAWLGWKAARRRSWPALAEASFYGAAFALLSAGLVASWSRGAWLAYGASLLAVAFALPRRAAWGAVIVAGAAALVLGAWASGRLPATITDRLASAAADTFNVTDVRGVNITPDNYAVVERLAHWQAALNMARANPWLGVGFGGYETAYEAYRLLNWPFPLGHAHNIYLNLLAETGIVGLSAYLALMACTALAAWRVRRHPDPRAHALAAGLLGAFAYLAVHSLTDNLFVNNLFMHVGVLFGLLTVLYNDVSGFFTQRTA